MTEKRELIKRQVTRFVMSYTCQICGRQIETIIGCDYESDEEALKRVASHFVDGWWVGDDQVVCVLCLSRAHEILRVAGHKRVKGFTKSAKQAVKIVLAAERTFAEDELRKLSEMTEDVTVRGLSSPEKKFLADSLKRVKWLRKKLGMTAEVDCT